MIRKSSGRFSEYILHIQKRSVGIQSKRIVDGMRRLREPAGAGLGDDHVIFEPDAELTIDADRRFVRERHAGSQYGFVAFHEIRPFVNVETDAVSGPVRQSGRRVARPKSTGSDDAARGGIDVLALVTRL